MRMRDIIANAERLLEQEPQLAKAGNNSALAYLREYMPETPKRHEIEPDYLAEQENAIASMCE